MIQLASVSARTRAGGGGQRAVLTHVDLEASTGVTAVVGTPRDGTALLLDLIDGTAAPRSGRVLVSGDLPDRSRAAIARVSMEAPLPDSLFVDEVCTLSSRLRGEARQLAADRLAVLGAAELASRSVRSLSREERRTVSLAIALTSAAKVVLVEEPLALLAPVAPSLVPEAVRVKARTACVIVTTSSPRDAAHLGERLYLLSRGLVTPVSPSRIQTDSTDAAATRIVVGVARGRGDASALALALSRYPAVAQIETAPYGVEPGGTILTVRGPDARELSRAITRAVGESSSDVQLVEPSASPLDVLRAAAARGPA